jgi:tripartite-type tricarboxylate transporter receptor subunit TctC
MQRMAWLLIAAIAPFIAAQDVAAQAIDTYPNAPVKLIVPFVAGGPTDVTARVFAERMSQDLGQRFVIENRPGADSAIGAVQVARAPADGYTLLFAMDVTLVMNPATKKTLSYDALNDFQYISLTSLNTSVLVVPANGPKTVQELIAYGRANPGKLNFGAGIITTRLAGVLFNKLAGIEAVYVPYKGSVEVLQALLDGSIQYAVDGVSAHYTMIKDGKERALAKLNKRELASLPELLPLDEVAGMPQLGEISTWGGIVAPKGTPAPIVDKLQRAIAAAAADKDISRKLLAFGIVTASNTPEEFAAFVKSETVKWTAVVKDSGLSFSD